MPPEVRFSSGQRRLTGGQLAPPNFGGCKDRDAEPPPPLHPLSLQPCRLYHRSRPPAIRRCKELGGYRTHRPPSGSRRAIEPDRAAVPESHRPFTCDTPPARFAVRREPFSLRPRPTNPSLQVREVGRGTRRIDRTARPSLDSSSRRRSGADSAIAASTALRQRYDGGDGDDFTEGHRLSRTAGPGYSILDTFR